MLNTLFNVLPLVVIAVGIGSVMWGGSRQFYNTGNNLGLAILLVAALLTCGLLSLLVADEGHTLPVNGQMYMLVFLLASTLVSGYSLGFIARPLMPSFAKSAG